MVKASKKPPLQTIIYLTRDLERALPLVGRKNHFIISNRTDFSAKVGSKYANVLLISEKKILDTLELLEHPLTKMFLMKQVNFGLVVFKNTSAIENICKINNWPLLNPPARISSLIEEKISQLEWLADLKEFLPNYEITIGKNLKYSDKKFIAQFNRSHTGGGTFLIDSEFAAEKISKKFPNRPIKKSAYIEGPVFTANILVAKDKIYFGALSYQITGLRPFTDNQFATIGNDWSLPTKILSKKNFAEYKKIGEAVGKKLIAEKWRGLFGIDLILDVVADKMLLLEINARQAASTSYESTLQGKNNLFEAHLLALQNKKIKPFINTKNGAQIIWRVPSSGQIPEIKKSESKLRRMGCKTIAYPNSEPDSDRLRIMCKKGIMLAPNRLNTLGLKIQKTIEKYG